MQLNLIDWDEMSFEEFVQITQKIRSHYWYIRNLRDGRFGQARLRKEYRKVALLKEKLLLAGHDKRDVLDLLACCRLNCPATKHPFSYCPHCGQGRKGGASKSSGVWAAGPMQAS